MENNNHYSQTNGNGEISTETNTTSYHVWIKETSICQIIKIQVETCSPPPSPGALKCPPWKISNFILIDCPEVEILLWISPFRPWICRNHLGVKCLNSTLYSLRELAAEPIWPLPIITGCTCDAHFDRRNSLHYRIVESQLFSLHIYGRRIFFRLLRHRESLSCCKTGGFLTCLSPPMREFLC